MGETFIRVCMDRAELLYEVPQDGIAQEYSLLPGGCDRAPDRPIALSGGRADSLISM